MSSRPNYFRVFLMFVRNSLVRDMMFPANFIIESISSFGWVMMNVGFYLLFSNALLGVWLLAFFGFDRLTVWRVRPGQMIEERMVGGEARSYDTNGLVFEKRGQDLFHDVFLGLGAGDLTLTTGGAIKETIHIPNVLLVNRKMKAIEKLIAVKPDHQA